VRHKIGKFSPRIIKDSLVDPKHQDNSLKGFEEESFPPGAENYKENSPVSRTNTKLSNDS